MVDTSYFRTARREWEATSPNNDDSLVGLVALVDLSLSLKAFGNVFMTCGTCGSAFVLATASTDLVVLSDNLDGFVAFLAFRFKTTGFVADVYAFETGTTSALSEIDGLCLNKPLVFPAFFDAALLSSTRVSTDNSRAASIRSGFNNFSGPTCWASP